MATQLKEQLESLLSVPEKHKLLNQFIHTTTEADVDNTLSVFCGQTFQHQLVRLRLAKKFHNVNLIIDLLKNGERGIMSEATKLPWIYNNESILLDPAFLMNEFFPHVSYSCRWRIINKMGRNVVDKNMSDKMDIIYDSIEKQYGFFSALPLIPSCSEKKLKSMMDSNKITKYSEQQLLAILKKYPELGISILKNNYNNFTKEHKYKSQPTVLLYLFDNHPNEFTNLLIDSWDVFSSSEFSLGRQRSKKFIQFHQNQRKELLLNHGVKLNKLLSPHQMHRHYDKDEFESLFLAGLPENIEDLSPYDNDSRMWKMLKMLPKTKRMDLLTSSFFKKYEMNLLEHPEYMSVTMIDLLPINSEDRMRIINWKIENDKNSYNWNYEDFYMNYSTDEERKWVWTVLKPIEQSIPELTLLYTTEQLVQNRATLSRCLILTCFFNQNPSELLKVLTLLSKRSRNDQADVRTNIFEAFAFIMNKMELAKEYFDIILEMIQFSELYKESPYDDTKEKILEKCITFHLKHNLPIENLFGILFKIKVRGYSNSPWMTDGILNPEDKKKLLLLYIKQLELHETSISHSSSDDKFQNYILSLLEHIIEFNQEFNPSTRIGKRYRKNKNAESAITIALSSVPWLKRQFLDVLKKVIESQPQKNSYTDSSSAVQAFTVLRKLNKQQQKQQGFGNVEESELEAENVVLLKYLNASSASSFSSIGFSHEYIFQYFLNHDPSKLHEKWSLIVDGLLKGNDQLVPFITKLQRMNYKLLNDKTIEICLRTINLKSENDNDNEEEEEEMDTDSDAPTEKSKAITYLSILCEPSIYLQSIVPPFYPVEAKVDVTAENSESDYELRKSVARSLIRISIPHLIFPALEKFCVGDYLKLTVGSLYSQCLFAPENKVLEFLRHQLDMNGRVSVQKHMIRLFFKISSLKDKSLTLQKSEKEETLISNNDTNATIRHEIFLQSFSLFRASPSQETWTLFKSRIEKLSPIDSQSIGYLRNSLELDNLCPPEILSECVRTVLTTLRRLIPFNAEHIFFNHTMTQIEKIIDKVDQSTLDEIILNETHESETGFPYPRFYVVYLLSSTSQNVLSHRLNNIKSVLVKAITNHWDTTTTEFESVGYGCVQQDVTHYKTREQVFEFIEELCKEDLNVADKVGLKEQIFAQVLKELELVSIPKIFKHSVYIQLALGHLKETEKSGVDKLKSFGASIAQIVDELVKLYGGEIISIIKAIVSSFLGSCFCQELECKDNIVELVSGLLSKSESRHCQIIAISLLQNLNPKKPNLKTKLDEILERIRIANDVAAQIFQETNIEQE